MNIRFRLAGLFLLASSLLATLPAQAQVFPQGNGISFSDLDRFDLYVNIRDWHNLDLDQQAFRLAAQGLIEEGLKELGVRRQPADRNYLVCSVRATRPGDQVAYTTSLEFWGRQSTDVHTLRWESGTISTIAADEFDEALVANECLSYFREEWSKWNQQPTG